MAERAGVDLAQLYEVLTHATGDCVAVRTRLPAEGVVPDSPASNGWAPGFMTDLMAKDLDLAIGYAAAQRTPLFTSGVVRQLLGAASQAGYGREDFSALAKVVRQLAGLVGERVGAAGARRRRPDPRPRDERDEGRAVARRASSSRSRARRSRTSHPQPGWAEQDPDEWWTLGGRRVRRAPRARRPSDFADGRARSASRRRARRSRSSTTSCGRSPPGSCGPTGAPRPRRVALGDPDDVPARRPASCSTARATPRSWRGSRDRARPRSTVRAGSCNRATSSSPA